MTKGKLTLAIVGDVYVKREDPSSIFALTREPLFNADIAFANQEAPLSTKGTPVLPKTSYRSEPRAVEALTYAGIDAVGLANNHTMDYGPEALLETTEVLKRAGIAFTGGGTDLEAAHRPAILERKGTRIAFLSYSSVFNPDFFPAKKDRPGIAVVRLYTAYRPHHRVFEQPGAPATAVVTPDAKDFARMIEDVQKAKAESDVVVVSWHWGISGGYKKIADYQKEMGKAAIDAGADVVVGHHPHFLQGIEVYKGKTIFYSLGNFAFEDRISHQGRESMIAMFRIDGGRIQQAGFLPVMIDENLTPELLNSESRKAVVDYVRELSTELGTHIDPGHEEALIRI